MDGIVRMPTPCAASSICKLFPTGPSDGRRSERMNGFARSGACYGARQCGNADSAIRWRPPVPLPAIHPSLCRGRCERSLRHIQSSDCRTPAAGYRHESSGALLGVGDEGDSWSSSPLLAGDRRSDYLRFLADCVTPMFGWYRSLAFPVRCVQASAGRLRSAAGRNR